MTSPPIIYRRGRVRSGLGTLSPSSEEPSFTRDALIRTGLMDRLQFKVGWDVVAGVNNKINFNRGGAKTATITAGNYATAALYGAAVKAALQAADATPTWTVAQNADTGLWTISTAAHSFTLLFATGTDRLASARLDLGMAAADTASSSNAVAGTVAVFQGMKFVYFDTGIDQGKWTISEGVNDTLDLVIDGPLSRTVIVAPGVYTSGNALAVAIQTGLETYAPEVFWRASYSATDSTFAIQTGSDFEMLFASGPTVARTIAMELGYTRTDHTGAVGYISDFAVSGSPFPELTLSLVDGHNIPSGSTVHLQASTASMLATGLEVAYAFDEDYTFDPAARSNVLRLDFATGLGYRYWRLVIDARASGSATDAVLFIEVGLWDMFETLELPGVEPALTRKRTSNTLLSFTPSGSHKALQRPSRVGWQLTVHNLTDANRFELEDFLDELGVGGTFYFNLDPDDYTFGLELMLLVDEWNFDKVAETNGVAARLWSASVDLEQVLG